MTKTMPGLSSRSRLLAEMRSGRYAQAPRLPRESELANELGISRTQLRDVLASLEREGFISRLHGVGTLINHHVLSVPTRTDLEVEFFDMLRSAGHEPELAWVETKRVEADEQVAERLLLKDEAHVLEVSRLITADGKPAIFCIDYIDHGLIKNEPYPEDILRQPIFVFLHQYCYRDAVMDITELRAVAANQRLVDTLGVELGSPLLYMDEVDYDVRGVPILYARQYYVDQIIHHRILRKKL